jgi:hypothetical protein
MLFICIGHADQSLSILGFLRILGQSLVAFGCLIEALRHDPSTERRRQVWMPVTSIVQNGWRKQIPANQGERGGVMRFHFIVLPFRSASSLVFRPK